MLYRDIMKKLMKKRSITQAELAEKVGLKNQALLSQRLKESRNPGMRTTQEMLDHLGYEIVFAPKGMVAASRALSEDCYVPEFPEE